MYKYADRIANVSGEGTDRETTGKLNVEHCSFDDEMCDVAFEIFESEGMCLQLEVRTKSCAGTRTARDEDGEGDDERMASMCEGRNNALSFAIAVGKVAMAILLGLP